MAGFDINQIASALAITGARPRPQRPESEDVPVNQLTTDEPSVTPPPTMSVAEPEARPSQIEDQAFTGRGNLKEQSLAGTNRAMDLVTEQGDIASSGAARQADLYGGLANEKRESKDIAKERVAGNRGQKDELEQKLFQQIDSISERQKHPPRDTTAMVMGILGAVMSAGGSKGGAVAAQLLGQALGSKTQAWASGIESDKENLKYLMSMHQMQDSDSDSELDHAAKINALAAGEFDSALRQVASQTDSEEAKRAADQARLALRQQALGAQMKINAAAGVQKQQQQLYSLITSQPTAELRAQVAGQYGKLGQDVLQDIQKSDSGSIKNAVDTVGIAKTQAETDKAAAEAGKARGEATNVRNQLGVHGLTPLESATPQDKTKAQEIVSAQQQLDSSLAIMKKLQGSLDVNDKATFDIQRKLALGSMNSLANAGVMNPGELVDWNEKMPVHAYSNAWNTAKMGPAFPLGIAMDVAKDDEKVFDDLQQIFRGKSDAALRTYNYARDTAPASAAGPAKVRVQLPDGRVGLLPAEQAQAAIAQGAKAL